MTTVLNSTNEAQAYCTSSDVQHGHMQQQILSVFGSHTWETAPSSESTETTDGEGEFLLLRNCFFLLFLLVLLLLLLPPLEGACFWRPVLSPIVRSSPRLPGDAVTDEGEPLLSFLMTTI